MARLGYPYDEFSGEGNGITKDTDYVKFSFYKYRPAFQTRKSGADAAVGAAETFLNAISLGGYKIDSLEEYNFTGIPSVANKGEAPNVKKDNLGKDLDVDNICLYMPEDLSVNYGSEWGGQSFTNMAAGALRSAASVTGGTGLLGQLTQELTDSSRRGMGFIAQQLVNSINAIPGAGSVAVNQVLQGVAGVIINPNTELMFDGFKLRQFNFNFKMSPRNYEEAKQIQKIVKAFKTASLPQYNEDTDTAGFFARAKSNFSDQPDAGNNSGQNSDKDSNRNYIGIPSLCLVEYMRGPNKHPFLPKYKLAALTDVEINYTPDGAYSTYFINNGTDTPAGEIFPVATSISLSFTESKLVYREEIKDGY